ncbi:MAG TPA: hypothetical protein DCE41_15500 [Cytophagales bacterium]|nr:hypothetical protein [Cytophagales bacterium]HAA17657.1 hypothetical protein [Cytophagales bacterium]HAP63171.1 hypothetical protein [Cytophagales bacterium]
MSNFLTRALTFWQFISTYGMPDSLDAGEKRSYQLTQSTAIVMVVVFLYNALYYMITDSFWAWFPNTIGLAHGLFMYAFLRLGWSVFARHFGLVGTNALLVFFAYTWGPGITIDFLPLIPVILGTLFFNHWRPIAGHFLLGLLTFFIINIIFNTKTDFFPLRAAETTYYINGVTLFIVLLVFVLIFRRQQNAYASELEKANRHILDSIHYAKRIQKGLLGTPESLLAHQQEGIVFFKPRDIVSGDFYWSAEIGQKRIIVAADCTGHGVPGAFMTVMGATFLEEIVNTQGITDPSEILYKLDERVIHAVASKGNTANDGMDMAILVLDADTRQVHYAGAKNPLLAVKDGDITYTKGNIFPIGNIKLKKPKKFVTHSFPWQPGTRYYLYSDGYQDQFGGPEKRKFLTKRFRNLLIEISQMPWEKQQSHLEETLSSWQGKEPQTDDILVVGLEV